MSVEETRELATSEPYRPLTDVERGYLAGLIDGEAYLGVALMRKSPRLVRGFSRHVVLEISNTNLDVLRYARLIIGAGSIREARKAKGKWRALYKLSLSANMIRRILPEILPILIVKKRQAILALEHLTLQTSVNYRYRPTEQERMDAIYHAIRQLNGREPREGANP